MEALRSLMKPKGNMMTAYNVHLELGPLHTQYDGYHQKQGK